MTVYWMESRAGLRLTDNPAEYEFVYSIPIHFSPPTCPIRLTTHARLLLLLEINIAH